jgi:hypothetical protein
MPVLRSGVIFGATARIVPSSTTTRPPARCLVRSGPLGPIGVWQLPQAAIVSTS